MKIISGLAAGVFSVLCASCLRGQNSHTGLDTVVEKLGTAFLRDKKGVGLSIGIYDNGKTYFYNFGSTTNRKLQPPNKNTVYEIGSITKTMVSFILANAVLENKVKLDDDIRKYLKGDYPNLAYNGSPIKLVHLANTTSLLPDWLPELPAELKQLSADSALALKIKYYEKLTRDDLFAALHSVKPDTLPGTRRSHSNAAAQLLAYILEDIYGIPLDKLIKRYITTPYKLSNTSFVDSKHMKNMARGYTASDKDATYEFVMPYFQYAGGLGSTSGDLVKYIKLLLGSTNPATVLSLKKTVDIDASTGKVTSMRPENAATPEVYSAALNWFKYQPTNTSSQVWADGGTNGFNSYLVLYPFLKSGVVVLANKSDEKIFRALPEIAYEISKWLEKN